MESQRCHVFKGTKGLSASVSFFLFIWFFLVSEDRTLNPERVFDITPQRDMNLGESCFWVGVLGNVICSVSDCSFTGQLNSEVLTQRSKWLWSADLLMTLAAVQLTCHWLWHQVSLLCKRDLYGLHCCKYNRFSEDWFQILIKNTFSLLFSGSFSVLFLLVLQ